MGEGVSKANICKGKYEPQLEFPEGLEGGMGYGKKFPGTTQLSFSCHLLIFVVQNETISLKFHMVKECFRVDI